MVSSVMASCPMFALEISSPARGVSVRHWMRNRGSPRLNCQLPTFQIPNVAIAACLSFTSTRKAWILALKIMVLALGDFVFPQGSPQVVADRAFLSSESDPVRSPS